MAKGVYVGVANCEPRELPSGYTQLEYIETCAGSNNWTISYIDTGVSAPNGFRFTGKISLTQITNASYRYPIIGSASTLEFSEPHDRNALYIYHDIDDSYDTAWVVGAGDYYNEWVDISVQTPYNIDFFSGKNNYYLKINGVPIISGTPTYTTRTTTNLYLGAVNINNTASTSKMKIWQCKIYTNDTLVRDYVPCQNSSGTVGLYDMVNKTFVSSANTAPLGAGPVYSSVAKKVRKGYIGIPVALPTGYTALEYIESTGTQYINTNFVPNQNIRITMNILPTSEKSGYVFGASSSSRLYLTAAAYPQYGYSTWTAMFDLNPSLSTRADINERVTIDLQRDTLIINNQILKSASYTIGSNTYNSLFLLAYNYGNNGAQTPISAKLYACRIYDNLTLVRDFIPCKNSGGTIGLYDLVNNQFYTNAGSGTFVAGPIQNNAVARQIKQAYIGIGGIARPCWPDREPVYYGKTSSNLTYAVHWAAATTTGNYALIAGGQTGGTYTSTGTRRNTINVYNSSLVKQSDLTLSSTRSDFCANNVGDYALFSNSNTTVDAFTSSLSKVSSVTSIGTSAFGRTSAKTGDYVIFAGGFNTGSYTYSGISTAAAYNKSLTKYSGSLTVSSAGMQTGVSIGGHALFAGGISDRKGEFANSTLINTVYAFDSSLSRSTKTSLSTARFGMVATTVGKYALFAGGDNPTSGTDSAGARGYTWSQGGTSVVDCYDDSLTKIASPTSLTYGGKGMSATTLGGFALFAGGVDAGGNAYAVIDCYDKSLTKTSRLSLSANKTLLVATTIGQYALFGGGHKGTSDSGSSSSYNTVDAYTIIE